MLSKAQILDHVWNYTTSRGDSGIVESYVSYLRRKVDMVEPRLIHTIRSVGYVLRLPGDDPAAAGRRPAPAGQDSLEVKLIVATLALVAMYNLIGLASVAALDGYLVGRLDSQLQAVARQATRAPGRDREGPDGHPAQARPAPFLIQYRDPAGKVVDTDSVPLDEGQPPEVPDDSAWLAARAGEPVTVPAAGSVTAGASWSRRRGRGPRWWRQPGGDRRHHPPAPAHRPGGEPGRARGGGRRWRGHRRAGLRPR